MGNRRKKRYEDEEKDKVIDNYGKNQSETLTITKQSI
jgi:hypothetical protein